MVLWTWEAEYVGRVTGDADTGGTLVLGTWEVRVRFRCRVRFRFRFRVRVRVRVRVRGRVRVRVSAPEGAQ